MEFTESEYSLRTAKGDEMIRRTFGLYVSLTAFVDGWNAAAPRCRRIARAVSITGNITINFPE